LNNFDEKAKEWDENPMHIERSVAIAEAMRKNVSLSKNMKAFEYGCGTGLLSFALQTDLGSITMADNSDGMLQVLHDKMKNSDAENLEPLKIDLTNDPLPDQKFDLIFTQMTLHHIHDIDSILNSFYNMLNENGILCIADLDKEDGSFHGKDVHDVHHGFDRDYLAEKMRKSGFHNIQFSTAYNMTREIDNITKTFPIFLSVAYSGI
jgi:ubiquinone/menaquinone biosynthesis C-methylase UbiE